MKIVERLHGLSVERHDEISLPQAGGDRGPAGLERGDEHRFGLIQPMEARHAPQQSGTFWPASPR